MSYSKNGISTSKGGYASYESIIFFFAGQSQQLQQPRVQSMQVASSPQQPLAEQRMLHQQQLQPTYRYITVKTEPLGRSTFALPTSQSTTFPGDDYQPRMNASSDSSNVAHPVSQRVTYLVNSVSTSAGGVANSTINAHMQRTYTDASNNNLQGLSPFSCFSFSWSLSFISQSSISIPVEAWFSPDSRMRAAQWMRSNQKVGTPRSENSPERLALLLGIVVAYYRHLLEVYKFRRLVDRRETIVVVLNHYI